MKGMILAAGLGTRLRPITDSLPKALVVVEGKSLLQHSLEHMARFGIREIIINVHHFPERIIDFLAIHHYFNLDIAVSDETGELLDTGGGVKKASWFFPDGNPFFVRNVDIISDLDIHRMEMFHRERDPLVTLAVRRRRTERYFLFDRHSRLCGWENRRTGERRYLKRIPACPPENRPVRPVPQLRRLAFSGMQIVNPAIFPLMTESGRFSLTRLYLRLAEDHTILGYLDSGSVWKDAGKPAGTLIH